MASKRGTLWIPRLRQLSESEADYRAIDELGMKSLPDPDAVMDLDPGVNPLRLVVEDEHGQFKMALIGGYFCGAVLLVDPKERMSEGHWDVCKALAAATVWGIAERAERLGARQSRAEVDKLLRETGLVEQMRSFGLWEDWAQGRRGRERRLTPG